MTLDKFSIEIIVKSNVVDVRYGFPQARRSIPMRFKSRDEFDAAIRSAKRLVQRENELVDVDAEFDLALAGLSLTGDRA
jgi:hypothetical protein